jgi:NitT/TauT family transport system permease protein
MSKKNGFSDSTTDQTISFNEKIKKILLSPYFLRAFTITFFLILWEVVGRRLNPLLMSYPTEVAIALWNSIISGEIIRETFTSLKCFSIGTGSAIIIGIVVGVLIGRYKIADYTMSHFLNALYVTPRVAMIPLIIMWFGLGLMAKIIIVFLVAVFPIAFNTADGVRNMSRSLVEVGKAYGANERQIVSEIMIPAVIPFIMSGVRLGIGRALTGMVVAEMFTAITGLGAMIVISSNTLQTDRLFVAIIVLAIFGIVLLQLGTYLERKFSPWKETEKAW